jgi:hypothetical protein
MDTTKDLKQIQYCQLPKDVQEDFYFLDNEEKKMKNKKIEDSGMFLAIPFILIVLAIPGAFIVSLSHYICGETGVVWTIGSLFILALIGCFISEQQNSKK